MESDREREVLALDEMLQQAEKHFWQSVVRNWYGEPFMDYRAAALGMCQLPLSSMLSEIKKIPTTIADVGNQDKSADDDICS